VTPNPASRAPLFPLPRPHDAAPAAIRLARLCRKVEGRPLR
jgi:hypothetical protein